jgi:NADPH-dependent 2,4-dienoyl-CoA reductase/sulfur reductase-like enzyme
MRLRAALVTVPYRMGTWPVRAEGHEAALRVWLTNGRSTWSEDCDMLAAEFGLVPNVELALALGCELAEGFVLVDRRQRTSRPWILAAGELVGIGGAECALVEGQIAGYEASGRRTEVGQLVREREGWNRFRRRLQDAFTLREELARLCDDETIVCRCEDVAFGRLKAMCGWREAKLYTRCGMGPCQGRVCGAATRVIWGWGMESVRPPVVAARMSSLLLDRTEDEAR